MRDIENLQDLAGVLLFDLWTSNQDPREMLFFRKPGEIKMRAHMIDSGYCFRGDKWAFHPDSYSVLHPSQHYFSWITGVDSFEPWLSRIEALEKSVIDGAWRLIPQAWYNETDFQRLKILLEQLDERRGHLRRIVLKLNRVEPQAFPLWQGFRECASP